MSGCVLDEITAILAEVLGEEFILGTEVTAETSFSEDLALESIEFVELSEKLQDRYGTRVNLADFVAGMDIDGIMALTVGQLARYIEAQLAAA
jgi:acyl carrier protein